jgi:hypothetical protein
MGQPSYSRKRLSNVPCLCNRSLLTLRDQPLSNVDLIPDQDYGFAQFPHLESFPATNYELFAAGNREIAKCHVHLSPKSGGG